MLCDQHVRPKRAIPPPRGVVRPHQHLQIFPSHEALCHPVHPAALGVDKRNYAVSTTLAFIADENCSIQGNHVHNRIRSDITLRITSWLMQMTQSIEHKVSGTTAPQDVGGDRTQCGACTENNTILMSPALVFARAPLR